LDLRQKNKYLSRELLSKKPGWQIEIYSYKKKEKEKGGGGRKIPRWVITRRAIREGSGGKQSAEKKTIARNKKSKSQRLASSSSGGRDSNPGASPSTCEYVDRGLRRQKGERPVGGGRKTKVRFIKIDEGVLVWMEILAKRGGMVGGAAEKGRYKVRAKRKLKRNSHDLYKV